MTKQISNEDVYPSHILEKMNESASPLVKIVIRRRPISMVVGLLIHTLACIAFAIPILVGWGEGEYSTSNYNYEVYYKNSRGVAFRQCDLANITAAVGRNWSATENTMMKVSLALASTNQQQYCARSAWDAMSSFIKIDERNSWNVATHQLIGVENPGHVYKGALAQKWLKNNSTFEGKGKRLFLDTGKGPIECKIVNNDTAFDKTTVDSFIKGHFFHTDLLTKYAVLLKLSRQQCVETRGAICLKNVEVQRPLACTAQGRLYFSEIGSEMTYANEQLIYTLSSTWSSWSVPLEVNGTLYEAVVPLPTYTTSSKKVTQLGVVVLLQCSIMILCAFLTCVPGTKLVGVFYGTIMPAYNNFLGLQALVEYLTIYRYLCQKSSSEVFGLFGCVYFMTFTVVRLFSSAAGVEWVIPIVSGVYSLAYCISNVYYPKSVWVAVYRNGWWYTSNSTTVILLSVACGIPFLFYVGYCLYKISCIPERKTFPCVEKTTVGVPCEKFSYELVAVPVQDHKDGGVEVAALPYLGCRIYGRAVFRQRDVLWVLIVICSRLSNLSFVPLTIGGGQQEIDSMPDIVHQHISYMASLIRSKRLWTKNTFLRR